MDSIRMPVVAIGVIASAAIGFAGTANAAPMGSTVSQTVESLQARGYSVIVNKTGDDPLDQCTVSAVRPGQTYTRTEGEVPGPSDIGVGIVTTVLAKTVYLDVAC